MTTVSIQARDTTRVTLTRSTRTALPTSPVLHPFLVKATVLWEGKPLRYSFRLSARSSALALEVAQRAIEKVYGQDAQLLSTFVRPLND